MMRLIRSLLVAALAVGALGVSWVHADEDAGAKTWGHGHGGPGMFMGKALGLSDKQEAKIKELLKANFEAMKPLRRELRDENFKLRDAMEDKDMSAVKAALDQLDATRKKLDAARERFRSEVSAVLDPMQRAKAYLMMQRRGRGEEGGWDRDGGRAGWGHRGRGRGGPEGWGRRHGRGGDCGMGGRGRGDWGFGGRDGGRDHWGAGESKGAKDSGDDQDSQE